MNNIIRCLLVTSVMLLYLSESVYADSSWVWISETRPYNVLQYVVILTLTIEIVMINYMAKVDRLGKTSLVVTIANLCSFLLPYWATVYIDGVHTYPDTLNDYHSIVIGPYLLLTLMIEIPIVMALLGRDVKDKKKLLLITLGANVLTTIMVYGVEKIFCEGYYI